MFYIKLPLILSILFTMVACDQSYKPKQRLKGFVVDTEAQTNLKKVQEKAKEISKEVESIEAESKKLNEEFDEISKSSVALNDKIEEIKNSTTRDEISKRRLKLLLEESDEIEKEIKKIDSDIKSNNKAVSTYKSLNIIYKDLETIYDHEVDIQYLKQTQDYKMGDSNITARVSHKLDSKENKVNQLKEQRNTLLIKCINQIQTDEYNQGDYKHVWWADLSQERYQQLVKSVDYIDQYLFNNKDRAPIKSDNDKNSNPILCGQ